MDRIRPIEKSDANRQSQRLVRRPPGRQRQHRPSPSGEGRQTASRLPVCLLLNSLPERSSVLQNRRRTACARLLTRPSHWAMLCLGKSPRRPTRCRSDRARRCCYSSLVHEAGDKASLRVAGTIVEPIARLVVEGSGVLAGQTAADIENGNAGVFGEDQIVSVGQRQSANASPRLICRVRALIQPAEISMKYKRPLRSSRTGLSPRSVWAEATLRN